VPCAEVHDGEIFATFDLPSGPFPGDSTVVEQAESGCFDRLADYAPNAEDDENLEVFYFRPDRRSWSRDRRVLCLATYTPPTAGSIRS
jgi:hypothetical protein